MISTRNLLDRLGVRRRDRRAQLHRHRARPGGGAGPGAGAEVRGRSGVAEAASQQLGARQCDRRVGRRAGQRLDRPSQRHRRCQRRRSLRESADGRVLSPRAAGPQVQPGRRRRRLLGRPWHRVRLAEVESRHLRGSQGRRMDWRQRRHRRPRPEVHAGRQVHRPVRQAGAKQGQQRHRELQPRGEDLRRSEGE